MARMPARAYLLSVLHRVLDSEMDPSPAGFQSSEDRARSHEHGHRAPPRTAFLVGQPSSWQPVNSADGLDRRYAGEGCCLLSQETASTPHLLSILANN